MKNLLFILLISCFNLTLSIAQQDVLNNFTTLKAEGKIPKEFLILSSDKYKKEFENNENKELDKDFFLSTRFFIDEILLSGNVLFGDPLTKYVNKVAKYVLRKDKNLYKELQFYVLKSNTVNAFSTDQGIIIVTTGLLSELDNEAQLAFIIGHEVAHYTQKHVRNSYVDKQEIAKGKGKYKDLSYNDKLDELSNYSKDKEFEADKLGVEYMVNTEYDLEEIYGAMGVLLYSYLPFEEIQFDTTYFNTDVLYIPGGFFPDTINPITKEEDFDDKLSSHPNIKKRMESIFEVIGDKKSRGTLKYKISESEFELVRNLARFESINLFLANTKYVEALYNTFLLQRHFENNKYLEFSKAKALYGLAKYRNHHRYNEVVKKYKKTEGEMFKLAVFIKNLNQKQINVIAYRHLYDLAKKYPNDNIIKKYERDMLKELALHSKIEVDELLAVDYKTYNDSIKSLIKEFDIQDSIAKIDASEDLSKYKKIKLKKALYALEKNGKNTLTDNDYYKTGLADIVTEGKIFTEIQFFIAEEELKQKAKEEAAKNKKNQTYLGIKKLVVVDPYIADYGLKDKVKKVKSEQQKVELNKMYSNTYNKLDLQTYLVDSKTLTENDVDKYNEIGILYQWINEIMEHDEIEMLTSLNDKVQPIKERYGTEHFMFSGIIKYKDRHEFNTVHLYGILLFYTIPLVLADLLIIHNYFECFSVTINSENDSIEYTQADNVNLKGRNLVMQAYIYKALYHLNRSK